MRNSSLILLSALLIMSAFKANAQKEVNEAAKKNAISVNILGTSGILGLTYQRMLNPILEAELGIGLIGTGAGIKYYPFKNQLQKFNPYIGFTYATMEDWVGNTDIFSIQSFYFPIGLNFCGKRGLNFGFDLGPNISDNSGTYGSIKLGYRF